MKSTILKGTLIAIAVVFIIIQFFRPEKNISDQPSVNAIEKHYEVPENVDALLRASCYDCHSNNTVYPIYNNIQPVAWWLADHVNEGKEDLNFDEFNAYTDKKKKKKLSKIIKTIEEGEMPLTSYTLIHTKTKLSQEQQNAIKDWAETLKKNF